MPSRQILMFCHSFLPPIQKQKVPFCIKLDNLRRRHHNVQYFQMSEEVKRGEGQSWVKGRTPRRPRRPVFASHVKWSATTCFINLTVLTKHHLSLYPKVTQVTLQTLCIRIGLKTLKGKLSVSAMCPLCIRNDSNVKCYLLDKMRKEHDKMSICDKPGSEHVAHNSN